MTRIRLFDLLIGLTFLSLLGSYIYDHYFIPTKVAHKVRTEIIKANDILRRKIKIPENFLNITATSSACTLFLKNSAEVSMNDYANEFIDHEIDATLKNCTGAFPSPLQLRITDAISKCQSSTREKITNDCYDALVKAKTKSVVTIIKTDIDPIQLNATILLHLIADNLESNDVEEHPEKTLALIDALLEK
jgi:hypothetical protein